MESGSIPAVWIGGLLFVAAVQIAGYLNPGYSHIRQSISELGAPGAHHGWIVPLMGFVPLGLSFVVFAFQSAFLFVNYIPSALIFLTGLAIVYAGIFPTDPDNRRDTLFSKIHASAVMTLMSLLGLTPLLFSIPIFYRSSPPVWFTVFSLLIGILSWVLLRNSPDSVSSSRAGAIQASKTGEHSSWPALLGLYQRLILALHYSWWFVFTQIVTSPLSP